MKKQNHFVTEEDIIKYRKDHPNCMYCLFLNPYNFLYQCKITKKSWLFLNQFRAKKCKYYTEREDDLRLALEAFRELQKG